MKPFRYPKTTVDAASESHPQGFASVMDAFSWAKVYLTRLSDRFGPSWVAKRLRRWCWTFSSSFSGIGAPETALTST